MNSTPNTAAFQKNLETLQKNYLKRLSTHLADLRRFQQRVATQHITTADIQQFYRLTHNFAGSGTTFGFPEISKQARLLHEALGKFGESERAIPSPEYETLHVTLLAFVDTCHSALNKREVTTSSPTSPELRKVDPASNAIGVFTAAADKVSLLIEQLRNFGYVVHVFQDFAALSDTLNRPDGILAAIIISDLSRQERTILETLGSQKELAAIPAILLTSQTDYETRLFAAKAGIQGCFDQSADILQIAEKLEQLVARFRTTPPYRILIVDDDEMFSEFYSHTLKNAGLIVSSFHKPKEAIAALDENEFDLILIDYTMPHCSGPELASIIRQQGKHVSMPIVFMSAHEDMEEQLINSGLGIDDFLLKPFSPEQMVAVVTSRARRANELKQLMIRDSFTGLLNHAHFLELLEKHQLHADRAKNTSVLAILDLDHFKSINDQYGHSSGDTVLRGLSRIMQQRMRRTDVIGRIGGEEFGIILTDCELEKAVSIIDSLRVAFQKLQFRNGAYTIEATFSAGLTIIGGHPSLLKLYEAADSALYRAKQEGRNRVVTG